MLQSRCLKLDRLLLEGGLLARRVVYQKWKEDGDATETCSCGCYREAGTVNVAFSLKAGGQTNNLTVFRTACTRSLESWQSHDISAHYRLQPPCPCLSLTAVIIVDRVHGALNMSPDHCSSCLLCSLHAAFGSRQYDTKGIGRPKLSMCVWPQHPVDVGHMSSAFDTSFGYGTLETASTAGIL